MMQDESLTSQAVTNSGQQKQSEALSFCPFPSTLQQLQILDFKPGSLVLSLHLDPLCLCLKGRVRI